MATHKYYGDDGSEYDVFRMAVPYHEEFQLLIANTLRTQLRSVRSPLILEIGPGTGFTTEKILARNPSATIMAVDIDKQMIAAAKKRLKGNARVSFEQADILKLMPRLGDETFDAVVSAYCVHNFAPLDRAKLYAGLRLVLKKGGVIVTGDKIVVNDVLTYWQHLREGIDRFSVFRKTKFPHLEALWTEHYLQDDAIRLTESEQHRLFASAWCDHTTLHERWGLDCVMSARRISK